MTPAMCGTMSDKEGSAMPSAGAAKSCKDILKESAVPSVDQNETATSLASSLVAAAAGRASSTRTTNTGECCEHQATGPQHAQQRKESVTPCARRRSSSNNSISSKVSFGTIEIHVVDPIAESASTTFDCGAEDLSSSSTAAKISSPTCRPSSSPPSNHGSDEEVAALDNSSQDATPASQTLSRKQQPQPKQSPNNTIATQEISTPPPTVATTATATKQPIKCGLETYERLRPPRRSRTELLLDAVHQRSRRKLSHQALGQDIIEAQKSDEKHHSAQLSATVSSRVDDNNRCTLSRSDAVMSRSSHLSLEATKNRRSKRLKRLQSAADGEIERSGTGGLRGWSSNFGGTRL